MSEILSPYRVSRRDAFKGIGVATAGVIMFGLFSQGQDTHQLALDRPQILGTTVSQKQCDYFGLDPVDTLKRTIDMGFDTIRLCVYWDEYEEGKRKRIEDLIKVAEENKIPMILNFGAKVARWPEWHLPQRIKNELGDINGKTLEENAWYTEEVLKFNNEILRSYATSPHATYLQPTNESLVRMGITQDAIEGVQLLNNQVYQVESRKRENQTILTSTAIYLWPVVGGDDETRYKENLGLSSKALGVNYYSRVPTDKGGYIEDSIGFWNKASRWVRTGEDAKKELWVTELQAEPWENGHVVYKDAAIAPSSDPEKTFKLLYKVQESGYKNVLLWGVEHWIYHALNGNDVWIKKMIPFIQQNAA